jgi:hypothetical protein
MFQRWTILLGFHQQLQFILRHENGCQLGLVDDEFDCIRSQGIIQWNQNKGIGIAGLFDNHPIHKKQKKNEIEIKEMK